MDKRITAMIAILIMVSCVTMVSTFDSVDADTTPATHTSYEGKCGTGTTVPTWTFTVSGSKLTISGSGTVAAISSWTVTKIDDSPKAEGDTTKASDVVKSFDLTISSNDAPTIGTVFAGQSVTKVSSFGKITTIPDGAFKGCTSLTSVSFTGVTSIGKEAFSGCTSLTGITIPSTTTTVSDNAFYGCTKIDTVTVPTTVTTVGKGVFEKCSGLTGVVWGKTTTIPESTFKGCSKINSINFGLATTVGKSAFEGCTSLTTLTMGDSVTTVSDNAFKDCTALTSVNLKIVQSLSYNAFSGCSSLATITTGTANTKFLAEKNVLYGIDSNKNKTSIFMNANKATGTISDIPTTVTTIYSDYSSVVYIIDITKHSNLKTFEERDGTRSIGIMYCTQGIDGEPSVNYSNGTFALAFKLYPGWSDDNCKVNGNIVPMTSKDGIYTVSVSCSPGKGYKVLPVGVENVTKAMLTGQTTVGGAWKAKFYLEAEDDPVTKIITKIYSYKCEIVGVDTKSLSGSATLQPKYIVLGVECTLLRVSSAYDYSGLIGLNVSGDVTIDNGTFRNIRELKTVTMDGLKVVPQELFRGCINLQTLNVKNCDRIGAYAFDSCVSLSSVDLGNTKAVDGGAFSGCMDLKYVLTDYNSTLASADDVFIIRCDKDDLRYDLLGDYALLVRDATGYSSIVVSDEAPKTLGAEPTSMTVYKGGMTVIDIAGKKSVALSPVSGANSQKYLVAFYTAGGTKIANQEISSGGKVTAVEDPKWDGYMFKGWFVNDYTKLGPIDTTTPVTSSFVYRAYWEMNESSTNLHIYGLTGIVVAFVASLALLVYHKLR